MSAEHDLQQIEQALRRGLRADSLIEGRNFRPATWDDALLAVARLRLLVQREAALSEALQDAERQVAVAIQVLADEHEERCGCDMPGATSVCVAGPNFEAIRELTDWANGRAALAAVSGGTDNAEAVPFCLSCRDPLPGGGYCAACREMRIGG